MPKRAVTPDKALLLAVESLDVAKVQKSLAAGANPDARDAKRRPALDRAMEVMPPEGLSHEEGQRRRREVVELLVDGGAETSPLHEHIVGLAGLGSVSALKRVIADGADVNVVSYSGTALTHAASLGLLEVAQVLLEAGGIVDDRAIMIAIREDYPKCALLLIPNWTPHKQGRAGGQLLVPSLGSLVSTAAVNGRADVVEALAKRGVSLDEVAPPLRSLRSFHPLIEAVSAALSGENVQPLLPPAVDQAPEGAPPLVLAAYYGHSAVVRVLVRRGAQLNATDLLGRSALQWASIRGHEDIERVLRRAGAAASPRLPPAPALFSALKAKDVHGVEQALDAGAPADAIDDRGDTVGWTALAVAAREGTVKSIRALLERGASVDLGFAARAGDPSTTRPLFVAVSHGHADAVRALLAGGAAPTCPDDPRPPLHSAAGLGHHECLEALLDGGADVHARDDFTTALGVAAHFGHLKCVERLLASGADVLSKNTLGQAVLTEAVYGLVSATFGGQGRSAPFFEKLEVVETVYRAGGRVDRELRALLKQRPDLRQQVGEIFGAALKRSAAGTKSSRTPKSSRRSRSRG